jgi:hypothetical protein
MSDPVALLEERLVSEYTQDILIWLRRKELDGIQCRRQSPQLSKRRHLIDWTCEAQQKLCLSDNTLHLAVRLMDLFMDGHDIQDPQLYLVCLGGLLLASKLEEKDGKIPRCSRLNAFVSNYFPLSDFFSLEFVMLNFFQWNICLPTVQTFCSFLLPHAVLSSDLHNNGPILSREKAAAYFETYVHYFLKVSLVDPVFIDCLPSLVAAAVLAAARRAFGFSPRWPELLQGMTGYSEVALSGLTSALLLHHAVGEAHDEGYESFSASPVVRETVSPTPSLPFVYHGSGGMETG